MTLFLLLLHGLAGVALLGALTHQLVGALRHARPVQVAVAAAGSASAASGGAGFLRRYASVRPHAFTIATVLLFLLCVVPGGTIYPSYRLDVRVPFEEMGLWWAVGLFEVKELWGGVGLGLLPLYAWLWHSPQAVDAVRDRRIVTGLLAGIVWFDFIAGHVLNNLRGLA